MPRTISDFKHKHVQGLYSYTHYEADDGAFVQVHARGDEFVYQRANGARVTVYSLDALKAELIKD
jgi:hypothetical protein